MRFRLKCDAEHGGTHLTWSLDVQVIEPFQYTDPGHHPRGGFMEVPIQNLHNPIQIQSDNTSQGAATRPERGW